MSKQIAVVDIETTDFFRYGGLIVEIGIVILDLETGQVTKIYDELVREQKLSDNHKNAWIFKNSDLDFYKILEAKPLDVQKLQEIFDKYPATAYNKDFDFEFLRSRGIRIKDLSCPMKIATDLCKIPSVIGVGYKFPKVQEAWDFLFGKTDYKEKHRGADDAEHEALIIYELYRMGVFKHEN